MGDGTHEISTTQLSIEPSRLSHFFDSSKNGAMTSKESLSSKLENIQLA